MSILKECHKADRWVAKTLIKILLVSIGIILIIEGLTFLSLYLTAELF
jgi:hypothetical protein